jgi:hypothetical protein
MYVIADVPVFEHSFFLLWFEDIGNCYGGLLVVRFMMILCQLQRLFPVKLDERMIYAW